MGIEIVAEVNFEANRGEVLAIVGESGSGKTTVGMALFGYARRGTRITGGAVWYGGKDILSLRKEDLRQIRGRHVSYVPQDPGLSLSPRRKIGSQLVEVMVSHGFGSREAKQRAAQGMTQVGLPNTEDFQDRYPFELSGGQQQRVLIAMALACSPDVVVLDEPTTGLDVLTQAQVLQLIAELAEQQSAAFIYTTHDLAVVDQLADEVAVMYAGRVVELGLRRGVFDQPAHPYTAMLIESVPRIAERHVLTGIAGTAAAPGTRPSGCSFRTRCPLAIERCAIEEPPLAAVAEDRSVRCHRPNELRPEFIVRTDAESTDVRPMLLEVEGVSASYGRRDATPKVLEDVSFAIRQGECVALVGESGSGKTTAGRCIAGLKAPLSGDLRLAGEPLAYDAKKRTRSQLARIQIVFQNPASSLNPSHSVHRSIERPMALLGGVNRDGRETRIRELLERVRLPAQVLGKYPAELSGGERQRVAIARALAAEPILLVCDEITSALDVSVQAAIVTLLEELKAEGLAMLFITHNLAVVNSLADRTLVLEKGCIIEEGTTRRVIGNPEQPYTRELLAAAPDLIRRNGDAVQSLAVERPASTTEQLGN
jgi:peptide/nickel transport system ATP-binding protein